MISTFDSRMPVRGGEFLLVEVPRGLPVDKNARAIATRDIATKVRQICEEKISLLFPGDISTILLGNDGPYERTHRCCWP